MLPLVTGLALEIAWGAIFLAATTLALIGRATAEPRGSISPPGIGARFTHVPLWAWWSVAGLFVLGTVLTFVLPS